MVKKSMPVLLGVGVLISLVFLTDAFARKGEQEKSGCALSKESVTKNELVAYFNFDTDARDSSGHASETADKDVSLTKGVKGQAYELNGIDDFMDLGYILNDEMRGSFTISVWIKLAPGALQQPHNYIFWKADDSPGLRVSGDRIIFAAYQEGEGCGMTSRSQVKEGRWYHIAYTFDGEAFAGYVNGLKETSLSNAIGYSPGGVVLIGADEKGPASGRNLKGQIDELKIWDYALSEKDIKKEYKAVFPFFTKFKAQILCGAVNLFNPERCRSCVSGRLIKSLD